MVTNVQALIHSYADWIGEQISVRTIGEYQEITTPFLDRHNDCIQIYLKELAENDYLLTDGGNTITDLKACGCPIDTDKRLDLLHETLHGFGILLEEENELTVHASPGNFPQRKHNLIQAILAVNDLAYTSKQNIGQLFTEDVKQWLKNLNVRYIEKTAIFGKSGIGHAFDIVIAASPDGKYPERIIQPYNNLNLLQAQALAFKWNDIKETRNISIYVVTKPGRALSKNVREICETYGMNPVSFDNLDSIAQQITA